MPAMLDDPTAPVIYRTSGEPPFPLPQAALPDDFAPRQVTLRDRSTVATLFAFSSPDQVPKGLLAYLCALLNREIEKGDTYPMINPLPLASFGPYWFANFGAIMLLGELEDMDQVWDMEKNGTDWDKYCLGSFYVKPNYPGRSSHVCNGGFLVGDASRNRGVGRLMGECYLEWAPKLGYTYSIFNLVYETNLASLRIWDALGFKRVGRVKGGGNLKSYPDRLIDAIIFGRDLNGDAEDYLSEERFDKIRFYLKTNTYPVGADRAEKSRLRSACAHYRLEPVPDSDEEKLMLKGKEVISDPQRQYQIARRIHSESHHGINKTTATIAEQYHWIRIKETVSTAIKNCNECKEAARPKVAEKPSEDGTSRLIRKQQKRKNSTSPAPSPGTDFDSPADAPAESMSPSQPDQQMQQMPVDQPDGQMHQVPVAQMNPHIHSDPQEQHPMPITDMNYGYDMHMPVDSGLDHNMDPQLVPQIMHGIQEHAGVDPYMQRSQHDLQYQAQYHDIGGVLQQGYQHDPSMDTSYMEHDPQASHAGAQAPTDVEPEYVVGQGLSGHMQQRMVHQHQYGHNGS